MAQTENRMPISEYFNSREKRNKYSAKATVYNGLRYDSKLEAQRAIELDFMEKIGEIICWSRQVPFWFGPTNFKYIVDFMVINWSDEPFFDVWYEDVKGRETPRFREACKMWREYGKMPLHIIKKGKQTEIIYPRWYQKKFL